ncbi:DUF4258 domain-containing protein [Candidatus Woesearchaeota archaeon]|nr:DUF4258 domain-containing protein [Candidatus Woesearchaeota archaeon]
MMLTENDLIITKHAQEKMHIEGISVSQIIEALERGSKYRQTDGLLAVHSYYSVAYKIIGAKYLIKTVFTNG